MIAATSSSWDSVDAILGPVLVLGESGSSSCSARRSYHSFRRRGTRRPARLSAATVLAGATPSGNSAGERSTSAEDDVTAGTAATTAGARPEA